MQITKSLTSLSVATLGGAVFSLISADIAQAVTFTFDSGDTNLSTIVKTVDGITLTVSNPSPDATFVADGDGLCVLGTGGFCTIDSFDVTFSSPVQLISYTVGYLGQLDENETLTLSDETSTSVENSPFTNGLRNFSNQFTVAAGQTITVTNTNVDRGDLLQWSTIEVTPVTAVPEPLTILGAGAAIAFGAGFKRKLGKVKQK